MTSEQTAVLFTHEGSQAVRLPEEFRFAGSAVRIRKRGAAVILEPLKKRDWPEGFWEELEAVPLPEDFVVSEPLPPSPHRDRVLDDFPDS